MGGGRSFQVFSPLSHLCEKQTTASATPCRAPAISSPARARPCPLPIKMGRGQSQNNVKKSQNSRIQRESRTNSDLSATRPWQIHRRARPFLHDRAALTVLSAHPTRELLPIPFHFIAHTRGVSFINPGVKRLDFCTGLQVTQTRRIRRKACITNHHFQ